MDRYKIAYKGLTDGEHSFDYHVDNSLFEGISEMIREGVKSVVEGDDELGSSEDILSAECDVHVELLKSEHFLRFEVSIDGDVEVECDRCLEPCSVPVEFDGEFTVKFSDEDELREQWDGEVMWLPTGESHVDLGQYIYESILLSLPYQRVHAEGECNAEMIGRFTQISADEFDQMESQAQEREEQGEMQGLDAEAIEKLKRLKETLSIED